MESLLEKQLKHFHGCRSILRITNFVKKYSFNTKILFDANIYVTFNIFKHEFSKIKILYGGFPMYMELFQEFIFIISFNLNKPRRFKLLCQALQKFLKFYDF